MGSAGSKVTEGDVPELRSDPVTRRQITRTERLQVEELSPGLARGKNALEHRDQTSEALQKDYLGNLPGLLTRHKTVDQNASSNSDAPGTLTLDAEGINERREHAQDVQLRTHALSDATPMDVYRGSDGQTPEMQLVGHTHFSESGDSLAEGEPAREERGVLPNAVTHRTVLS